MDVIFPYQKLVGFLRVKKPTMLGIEKQKKQNLYSFIFPEN